MNAVLVLTRSDDPETALVINELTRREAAVVRCDIADFPKRIQVTAAFDGRWRCALRTPDGDVDLRTLHAVYYRRPSRFDFPDDMTDVEREFAGAESRNGLGGIFASLACRWVNHPSRIADAEYKPLQLHTAAHCGLTTPGTVLTNEPEVVKKFAADMDGPMLYKPLSPGMVREGDRPGLVYATIVDPADLNLGRIDVALHLFQEWVTKAWDARVTVAGDSVFAVAIHAGSARARVDWRADYDALGYEAVPVPDDVRTGIRSYLRQLGLSFGAFDFTVTPAGQWVFLECNPSGLWGWIEEETRLPIASAIAELLAGGYS